MELTVLGCAGGIGGRERLTTCLLLDETILLDAGTGLTSLSIEQLVKIDHVFLTHSHLDHVVGLALLADAVLGRRTRPITVHATDKVVEALYDHVFNWRIWPDFTLIPSPEHPVLKIETMEREQPLQIGDLRLTSFAVQHTVDASGYLVEAGDNALLFTGDMFTTPSFWSRMRSQTNLRKVIVDCSFPDEERELANVSRHYCPGTLLSDVTDLPQSVEFLIYHLKPGMEQVIMDQLNTDPANHRFRALSCGDVFTI